MTAGPQVLGISFKPSEAETLPNRTNSIGATLLVGAKVSHSWLLRETSQEGVSFMLQFAPTVIPADSVDTDRICSAYFIGTFVDIKTPDERVSIKALSAGTFCVCSIGDTLRISPALAVFRNVNGGG